MCTVAPDLSYRQALANFGLPALKERRERLARDFFIKIVKTPDHKLRHLSHLRELSSIHSSNDQALPKSEVQYSQN